MNKSETFKAFLCVVFAAIMFGTIGIVTKRIAQPKPMEVYDYQLPAYETIMMEVTAYCPCDTCCDVWSDGYFADGSEVGDKAIAADTLHYGMGTEMTVPGYGTAVVKDRGGAIKGANRIDVYFDDHQTALEFGRRKNVNVQVRK